MPQRFLHPFQASGRVTFAVAGHILDDFLAACPLKGVTLQVEILLDAISKGLAFRAVDPVP